MIMLKNERNAKAAIMQFLAKQGYPRYASLLSYFDVNLTSDPNTIAYVENDRARIVINKYLSLEQVSVVVRHELLHRWLRHAYRAEKHVGKDAWDKRTYGDHQIFNIAADYEISNRGYTDEDKKYVRNIEINDPSLSRTERNRRGLVTEDDHPEWVNLSMEEMMDKLNEVRENNEQVLKDFLQALKDAGVDLDNLSGGEGSENSEESENNEESSEKQGNSSSKKKQSKEIRDLEDIKRALEKKKENKKKAEQKQQKGQGGESSEGEESSQDNNASSEGQKNNSQNQGKENSENSLEDALGDLIDQTIDQLKDSKLSDQEKDTIAKKIYDKLNDALGNKDKETDPKDAPKSLQKKMKELIDRIEKEAAEQEEEISNPDLDRETIDQNIHNRISSIEDILDDANELEQALRDSERKQQKEQRSKKEKEAEVKKYSSNTYDKELFLEELDRLIKSQIDRVRQPTYNYPARKRVFGSNIIFQGQKWQYNNARPKVVVYYDRSGSWQVDWKTKAGDDAIAMLNDNYVRKNLIDLEIRYFADTVSDNPRKVGGGNAANQEILDDIVEQRATNVILMTDSDIDNPWGYSRSVEVPGGVFFLFVDGESPAIVKSLHGKQLTRVFKIESRNGSY